MVLYGLVLWYWLNSHILVSSEIFFMIAFIVAFFVFYAIRRIYILSISINIYLMTFIIQQMNTFKDKITTFYDIPNLICYQKEAIEKVFCNFIFFTLSSPLFLEVMN